jgi:DNA-binding NtrC family response regulator
LKERHVALVADRFSVSEGGRAVDLATGEEITLLTTRRGAVPDERRWLSRCDRFQQLWHREVARLVDYGGLGDSHRFEAWLCGARSNATNLEAMRILESASAFLRGCGWTAGRISAECLRTTPRGLVVLPPEDAGYDQPAGEKARSVPLSACGIAIVERRATAALAEMFEIEGPARPRAAVLLGPPGSGKSAILCSLARVGRQHGFVPISAALVRRVCATPAETGTISAEIDGRSLFILDDGEGCAWEAWLTATVRVARPHVLVMAASCEEGVFPGLRIDDLSPDALAASIRPEIISAASARRVHRAAVRAAGVPGRFVQMLRFDRGGVPWRLMSGSGRLPTSRAAEQIAPYGGEGQVTPSILPPSGRLDPDSREPASLGEAAEAAVRLLRAGRHASGERALRQEIGRLVRRADYRKAGRSALALSASLLMRGQAREARSVVKTATEYLSRAADRDALTDAATLTASAWVDLGRPGEGEVAATAAIDAARASGDPARVARGSLALARALFWRGEYADADLTLGSVPLGNLDVNAVVRIEVMRSRIAVGLGDSSRALAVALSALERANSVRDDELVGAARCGVAFVRLALGDLEAVERDTVACVAAARAAHDPLRAIRCRLLAGEAARRRDRLGVASSLVERLRTLARSTVPPIINARRELLSDLIKAGGSAQEVVDRHVAATGLPALALLAGKREVWGLRTAVDPVAAELVEILQSCQGVEDEAAMLTDVCRRLRRQLHAVAVGFVSARGSSRQVVATSGGRIHLDVAERALAAGLPIAPYPSSERVESAAPVRYGGAVVGALVCRWPPGSSPDVSRVPGVLAITAVAAAPALAALIDRNVRPPASNREELLGVSPAIQEIGRAVERAAAAPYPVLIEGESGCGKELVARAVHASGPRRDRAFCTVNCAALPDDLIEAELFGHARGAFTGAVAERPGLFEEANAGTLFLDEIGELSLRAQAKVLRVVQEGLLRRLGENVSRRVDVRLVSATNRNLRQEVAQGRFRTDLYYRLNVIAIAVPPLRDRREDIAPLIEHFWRQATARVGSRAILSTTTIAALTGYDWPGNVRELENVLAALAVRAPKHGVVSPAALPPPFERHQGESGCRLDEARRTFEHHFVRAALVRAGGGRTRAARELGVTRQGLSKLMARLGIADGQRELSRSHQVHAAHEASSKRTSCSRVLRDEPSCEPGVSSPAAAVQPGRRR